MRRCSWSSRSWAGRSSAASWRGEIVITGREFYDFEAKYLDAPGIDLVCPAQLADGELAEMQRIAARAFEAVGGEGLARVDFFFTGTEFFVNEVNTMPGFTPISMFPKCWIATGMTYDELVSELIDLARVR
jgi:D-alanine-D-alanine ligase